MEIPSSMNTQKNSSRPIYPWEMESTVDRKSNHHQNQYPCPTKNQRQQRPLMNHRLVLLSFICLVTLAFAAGTLLDGNSHATNEKGKERGKHIPAATNSSSSNNHKSKIAQVMLKVYQELEHEFYTKAFHESNQKQWKVLNEKHGAKVSLLDHPSDPTCPYVKMEITIPVSAAMCWEFLSIRNWDWSMTKMDPFYDQHTVYANYSNSRDHAGVNLVLVRKQTHRILTFGKRDYVFLSVSGQPLQDDGSWVSGIVSVESPDVPRQDGYTRAFQDSISFYKPVVSEETGEEHCRVTIVCRIDLNDSTSKGSGGFMPMWFYVKTVGTTGVKSLLKMKDAMLEMKQEKTESDNKVTDQQVVVQRATSTAPTLLPTLSPTLSSDLTKEENAKKNILQDANIVLEQPKWWMRVRGGAFGSASMTTTTTPQTSHGSQALLLANASVVQTAPKWQLPLFGVYSHIPAIRQNSQWLQHKGT